MVNTTEVKVLFGGLKRFNKKDKVTGVKLAEMLYTLQILQVDTENNYVESNTYFINEEDYEKYLDLDLKCLKPIIVVIEFSATSNYSKVVDIKKIVDLAK